MYMIPKGGCVVLFKLSQRFYVSQTSLRLKLKAPACPIFCPPKFYTTGIMTNSAKYAILFPTPQKGDAER